jgi:hypothetical protein
MFSKIMTVLAVCAAAMTASIIGSPAASAASYTMHTDDGDPGGRVKFETDGDVVTLCDIEADGWGVYLNVRDQTQNIFKYQYTIGGDGNCQTFRASLGGAYDLRENSVITFKICLRKDGDDSYCDTSNWANVN